MKVGSTAQPTMQQAVLEQSSYEELTTAFAQLQGLQNAMVAEQLKLAGALALHDDELHDDGLRGLSDWLAMAPGMKRTNANNFARLARRLDEFPSLFTKFASGRMSYDRFELVTHAIDDDHDEEWWAENEQFHNDRMIRIAIARLRPPPDDDDPFTSRRLTVHITEDGGQIKARGPKDIVELIRTVLDRSLVGVEINGQDILPSVPQARFDALHQLCSQASRQESDPDLATVVVEVTVKPGGSMVATLGEFGLRSETLQQLSCDARLQVATLDGNGKTVGISRTSRTIPHWLRRRLLKRDQGCRYPGCGKTLWVHAHHIRFWSEGGTTNLDNLILLCPVHHRYLHQYGYAIDGNPEHGPIWFVKPNGERIQAGRTPPDQMRLGDFVTDLKGSLHPEDLLRLLWEADGRDPPDPLDRSDDPDSRN